MNVALKIAANLLIWPFKLMLMLVRNIADAVVDVDAEWNLPGDMPWEKPGRAKTWRYPRHNIDTRRN